MSSPNIAPLLSGHVIGSVNDAWSPSGATQAVPQARRV